MDISGFLKKKYSDIALSVLLAIYIIPTHLFYFQNYALEGSWKRAINLAVKNHIVFGTQFIFTFGPLGFLSTRNHEYLGNFFIVLGDLFLVTGFYYFLRKYVSRAFWRGAELRITSQKLHP